MLSNVWNNKELLSFWHGHVGMQDLCCLFSGKRWQSDKIDSVYYSCQLRLSSLFRQASVTPLIQMVNFGVTLACWYQDAQSGQFCFEVVTSSSMWQSMVMGTTLAILLYCAGATVSIVYALYNAPTFYKECFYDFSIYCYYNTLHGNTSRVLHVEILHEKTQYATCATCTTCKQCMDDSAGCLSLGKRVDLFYGSGASLGEFQVPWVRKALLGKGRVSNSWCVDTPGYSANYLKKFGLASTWWLWWIPKRARRSTREGGAGAPRGVPGFVPHFVEKKLRGGEGARIRSRIDPASCLFSLSR